MTVKGSNFGFSVGAFPVAKNSPDTEGETISVGLTTNVEKFFVI